MKAEHNELFWHRLDHTTVFFDSVYRIPEAVQSKYSCNFCHAKAEYSKLDSKNVPTVFFCREHLWQARRG